MNDQESHDCKKAAELIDYALGVLTVTPTPSESDLRGVKYMLRDASARLSRDSSHSACVTTVKPQRKKWMKW